MTENLLRGGDYVPDGFGGFVRLQEEEALLERALFKLTCRRGAFPFLPELGSRLRELGRLRPSARNAAAQQYAAQALEGYGYGGHGRPGADGLRRSGGRGYRAGL